MKFHGAAVPLALTLAAYGCQSHPEKGVVDQYFDFAEKVLASQREFASQWASAAVKASEAVTEQAQRATQSVATQAANGTATVVNNATEAAKAAGEKAASTARAARNATKA